MANSSHYFEDRFTDEIHGVFTVASDDSKRYWSIVVHEGAECFKDFADKIEFFNEKSSRWYNWAYILHDKDTITKKEYEALSVEEQMKHKILNVDKPNDAKYALVPPHYHALLCFEDLKSWSRIKKGFQGAHCMICQSVSSSYAYLTHDTKTAIAKGKYQYPKSDIVTNNVDYFERGTVSNVVFEVFDPHMLSKYVFVDKMRNYIDFANRFSIVQVQKWLSSINSMCNLADLVRSRCQDNVYVLYNKEDKTTYFYTEKELIDGQSEECIFCDILPMVHFSDYGLQYITAKLISESQLSKFESWVVAKCLPDYVERFKLVVPEMPKIDKVVNSDYQPSLIGYESQWSVTEGYNHGV